ncbi:MAG: hypothetical protein KIT09_22245 [Bryobacteraceae bacterium]|nr:hypothetical protein [Bryobacteraceae bacterium]
MLSFLAVNWTWVLLGLASFVLVSAGSLALISAVLVRLPATYFTRPEPRGLWIDAHPVLRWTGLILKNVLGVALVALGVVLSLPGVPGPGLLTILVGLALTDFPGKRRLQQWLLQRPAIRGAVNRLRHRYGKPPFVLDEPAA